MRTGRLKKGDVGLLVEKFKELAKGCQSIRWDEFQEAREKKVHAC